MSEKKYYWLKLPRDFFKRHDIKFIKTLPHGYEIAFFYVELMAESVDHDGELRFSPGLPYSEVMLAALTDTPVEIVTEAMKVLKELGLIIVTEDGTIQIPKVEKMIGSAGDSDNAKRQQRYRDRKKAEKLANVTDNVTHNVTHNVTVTTNSNERKSKRKSKSKSKSKNMRESKERNALSHFEPPTVEQVFLYCEGRHNGIDAQRFVDYYTARGWKNVEDWKAQIRVWESKISDSYES